MTLEKAFYIKIDENGFVGFVCIYYSVDMYCRHVYISELKGQQSK